MTKAAKMVRGHFSDNANPNFCPEVPSSGLKVNKF